jgi:hypothetical protein
LKPPQILLQNNVGEQQEAVAGSFCVDYVDPASGRGSGVCGDSPAVHPDAITIAMAGDEVMFVFRGADIVRPSGCHGEEGPVCRARGVSTCLDQAPRGRTRLLASFP